MTMILEMVQSYDPLFLLLTTITFFQFASISISTKAVNNLLDKHHIDPMLVGRLEVGSETQVDKSKSIKSVLMDIFAAHGNTDMEGVDCKNACYGGTSALLNSLNWVESSAWDGRFALVVAGDNAIYSSGNARPTGGAGAIAMLIGVNAPIVFDRGVRSSHMQNIWDFYKPDPHCEYPTVDGTLSNECFLLALDRCYNLYAKKYEAQMKRQFSLDCIDYCCMHSPYNKLVQKSFARILYNDMKLNPQHPEYVKIRNSLSLKDSNDGGDSQRSKDKANHGDELNQTGTRGEFSNGSPSVSDQYPKMEREYLAASKLMYNQKVACTTLLPRELGNLYTGSIYSSLISLLLTTLNKDQANDIHSQNTSLIGKRVLLFSYGSGLTSTMFSLVIKSDVSSMISRLNVHQRLQQRIKVNPAQYSAIMEEREKAYKENMFINPKGAMNDLFPGTWHLTNIDNRLRRLYARVPLTVFEPKL